MTLDPKPTPPRRWLDEDSDAPPEVRRTLDLALRFREPARVARLERRLLPLLAVPPFDPALPADLAAGAGSTGPVGGGAIAASGVAVAPWVKLVVVMAVAGGAGTATHLASRSEPAPVRAVPPHVERPASAVPLLGVRAPSQAPAPASSPRVQRAAEPPRAPARGRTAPPRSSLNDEAALLSRANAILATDPAAARALLSEHARRFPDGVLRHERERLIERTAPVK